MPLRHLPVYPDLDLLKEQARDLLGAIHAGDPGAVAELMEFHPDAPPPERARLADARLVLARSYHATNWTRLVQGVALVRAIWADDIDAVRTIVTRTPQLVHEDALIRKNSNWGPPMSYAANVGRDGIIRMLHDMGATDHTHALGRAALQGKTGTARLLHELLGKPTPPDGCFDGPAYTLNVEGTALMFELGARVRDDGGKLLVRADTVIQTDSRKPAAKHAILEMYVSHGVDLPDTAPTAVHRGSIELLERQLRRDPLLLSRTFSHREIYPAELGCGDPIDATVGTPLDGATLLHMCVDYDEIEIARWLLDNGMDVNARARVGASGFGGYTALFATVVSQPNFWMNYQQRGPFSAPFAELLLERGADPNVRASLWKQLHPGYDDPPRREYRDVTALSWGQQYPNKVFVSEPAMRLIADAGGVE